MATSSQSEQSWGWRDKAECRKYDPEIFFPERHGKIDNRDAQVKEAKAICAKCEVTAECLEYAIERDERFGIWGGLTVDERAEVKRRRNAELRRRLGRFATSD